MYVYNYRTYFLGLSYASHMLNLNDIIFCACYYIEPVAELSLWYTTDVSQQILSKVLINRLLWPLTALSYFLWPMFAM